MEFSFVSLVTLSVFIFGIFQAVILEIRRQFFLPRYKTGGNYHGQAKLQAPICTAQLKARQIILMRRIETER